jgi:hypothetical protein
MGVVEIEACILRDLVGQCRQWNFENLNVACRFFFPCIKINGFIVNVFLPFNEKSR